MDEVDSIIRIGCTSGGTINRDEELPDGGNGVSVDLVESEGCAIDVAPFAWQENRAFVESMKMMFSLSGNITVFRNILLLR